MDAYVSPRSKVDHVEPRTRIPSRRFPHAADSLSGEFTRVLQQGQRLNGPYFSLIHLPGVQADARLGIAISRRVSPKATERNRIKRAVRECFRHVSATLPAVDIVVLLRPAVAGLSAAALRQALTRAFVRLRQSRQSPSPPV